LGNTQTQVFDPLSRVIEQKNELNQSIFYQYDAVGRLTQLKDANLNTTHWTYDTLGRQLTETDPRGFVTTSSYDAVGNLTRQVDRRGKVIDYGYDGLDRLTTETWHDTIGGAAVKTLGFSYNSIDQLLTASDGGVNKLVRTYDKLGRLKTDEQTDARGLLTYSYDAASNKTLTALSINGTGDLSNAYTRDKLGRMTAIEQSGGGARQKRAEFAYDKLDRQTGITRKEHNGTSLVTVSTSAQAFDFAGRLTSLQHYGINTSVVLAGYTFNWDAGDRIESITSVADGLVTFSYDATDQLLAANYTLPALPDETYSFDALGNRNSTGYTTGTGNLTSADATYDYTYDQEGNRTLRVERATGKRTEYTWDHRQRLIEIVTRNTAGGAVTSRVQYQYDPLDQRVGKDIDSNGDSTFEKRERFIHEDGEVLAVVNTSWQRLNRFLHGPLVDQVLAEEVVNPSNGQATQVNWLLSDHLGTVRDVARHSAGSTTVVDHIFLNSFGVEVSHSAADPGHRFGFTGRDRDLESDLDYYRARYYDPRLGRFISQDPIGFEANDPNVQRYVGNSVTLATDPSGRDEVRGETYVNGYRINDSNWFGYAIDQIAARTIWPLYLEPDQNPRISEHAPTQARQAATIDEQLKLAYRTDCISPGPSAGTYAGITRDRVQEAQQWIKMLVDVYGTFLATASGLPVTSGGIGLRIPVGSARSGAPRGTGRNVLQDIFSR
jgi:RHS repeat-associated protein